MTRCATRCLVIALLLAGATGPASAQGGLLDWISKLSGPSVASAVGFADYCLEPDNVKHPTDRDRDRSRWLRCDGLAVRGYLGHSLRSGNEPDGSNGDVDVLTLGPALVYQWNGPRTVRPQAELGLSSYRFSGSGFEGFWRYAPTLSGSLRVGSGRAKFEVGVRLRYFTEGFRPSDFGAPGRGDSGSEWNWGVFTGVSLD